MSENKTIKNVISVILVIAIVCGALFYFKDTIYVFINEKVQSANVENQINGLQKDEEEKSWEESFYTCDGKDFLISWNSCCGYDSGLMEKVIEKSESNCIWFEENGSCEFYNVDDEMLLTNVEKANKGSLSLSNSDIVKNNKDAQKFLLRFNKNYKTPIDGTNFLEPAYENSPDLNPWDDKDWDNLNVEEFYKKYKVVTKAKQPVLKKVMIGTYVDEYAETKEANIVVSPCMVFEIEITNLSSDAHPLQWFPQPGETKKVNILIQGAYDDHGSFCVEKGAIL